MNNSFLPISNKDLITRGIKNLDFIIISGDAYVDHPSFGHAIIGRYLEAHGFTVGIIAQPNWKTVDDFKVLGRPNLAFLVTSGNLDSMVRKYTVNKNKRRTDSYSPGSDINKFPDRAVIVYTQLVKKAYQGVNVIIGGLEASLRRFAHYDYLDNQIRRSILLDAKADLLVYGMAEKTMLEIAEALKSGIPLSALDYIRGTSFLCNDISLFPNPVILPHFQTVLNNKKAFAQSFLLQQQNNDPITGQILIEPYQNRYLVQNPPALPLASAELDSIYMLPYQRKYHPIYEKSGGVPALKEVQFSLVSARGCFGGCSFCAISAHQGRIIQSRSQQSLVEEATLLTKHPDFKGYIHDLGGPTANFFEPACKQQLKKGACAHRQCLFPEPCPQLKVSHQKYLAALKAVSEIEGVKKVFIRSGIRFDYLLLDKNLDFFKKLCQDHISGQLKVAPEHISNQVLAAMGKPPHHIYEKFRQKFKAINQKLNKKQFLLPYFIASHPDSTLKDAVALADYLKQNQLRIEQVQDFYPTPNTLATCMYYTELDVRTMQKIYVPKSKEARAMQRALLQYYKPENKKLVAKALKMVREKRR